MLTTGASKLRRGAGPGFAFPFPRSPLPEAADAQGPLRSSRPGGNLDARESMPVLPREPTALSGLVFF